MERETKQQHIKGQGQTAQLATGEQIQLQCTGGASTYYKYNYNNQSAIKKYHLMYVIPLPALSDILTINELGKTDKLSGFGKWFNLVN